MTTKIRTDNTNLGSDTGGIVIPKGTTAQRTDSEGAIRYNTTSSLFEYYDGNNWITLEPTPQVTSVTPTSVKEYDSTGTTTFTITGTGFKPGITAQLVSNTGSIISFDTVTRNSNVQLTATISNANVITQAEPFDIKVTSATGLTSTISDQININNNVYFTTASGSLGTQRIGSFSAFVEAIDPESAGVGYELAGGALPPGFTLNSATGEISGTITLETSDTTYTFIIRAYDTASNVAERQFSITLQGPVAVSFTTAGAGTFPVPTGVTSIDALIVAGGGGGATGNAGGGGGGGLIFRPGIPVTPGSTVSFQIGNTSAQIGVGNDTTFTYNPGPAPVTLTAKGGGAGGSSGHEGGQGGQQPGGSGGGSGGQGGAGGTGTQPSQPGDSATYGFGNPGGSGSTTGGGGGGAGQTGKNAGTWAPNPASAGAGGDGKAYDLLTPGSPVFYAGGGGGGGGAPSQRPGAPGGSGGGGGGSGPYYDSASPGSPGQPNTGGGGGGSVRGFSMQGMSVPGSTGGSGIIIIKY
jgi:hypothetical protein